MPVVILRNVIKVIKAYDKLSKAEQLEFFAILTLSGRIVANEEMKK